MDGGVSHVALLRLTPTKIDGCFVIDTEVYEDQRGNFYETYNERDFNFCGLPTTWRQDNLSNSIAGALRGLHIQRYHPQGKLVRCLVGAVWDVCVDVRKGSPTFGQWHAETLVGSKAMYLPPGTAHGIYALRPRAIVYYKCSTLYDKHSDGGINPLDSDLAIPWPDRVVVLSDKDKTLPSLKDWEADPRGLTYE
jgi:dTDP-4-dehydrorhamnose 3,5-epimerase